MKRLFLLDGHALIFKVHYAFFRNPMVNSAGMDISILYGFTKSLLELIEKEKPTHMAVAFDPPGGTFRNEMYPQYKANRPPTPQLVIDALEPLQEMVKALGIPVLMIPGFEADDVIGSMAKSYASKGDADVYMVTPDKDYGQLIEEHIFQYKSGKGGGEREIIGISELCSKYNITKPAQIVDMLAIWGDSSDNVPGVKGIGEVGASKLITKYGNIDGIYAHLDELSARQKQMFEDARGHIGLSRELVTIKTDIPIDISDEELRINLQWNPAIADLFEKYSFRSLRHFFGNTISAIPESEPSVSLETEEVSPIRLSSMAVKTGCCSMVATENGITFCCNDHGKLYTAKGPASQFRSLLESANITKCGTEIKAQLASLWQQGIKVDGKLQDVSLMHYLLDPEKSHSLDMLSQTLLSVNLDYTACQEVVTGDLFAQETVPQEESHDKEAAAILMIAEKLSEMMEKEGITKLYDEIEEPLIRVLAHMERSGVKVDLFSMKDFANMLASEVRLREEKVREMASDPNINISSPRQVGVLLFEKMKLDPKARKNSNGSYSTDEATLRKFEDKSPIVAEILEYRAAKKLLSTYIEPFGKWISPRDGKVHTTFNQALTSTGRLSSSSPNLQNIPIRTERGREIRKAFVPSSPDGLILSADYSQIELRVMAHFSHDEHMIKAFNHGEDVHKATAAKIFGIDAEEVTAEQRRIAKTANFGIMYGISTFGLAERLHIGRSEAKKIIEDYFESFPTIQAYINSTLEKARNNGYVETLFGRRRYIPDINAQNATLRALAERNAVNAPIQGTAADIIKLAMIRLDRRITETGLRSRMVLQVHDELVFDTFPDEVQVLKDIVIDEMEGVIKLTIPLTVECNYGKNWLEAH